MADKVPMAVHLMMDSSGSMAPNQQLAIDAGNEFLNQLALSVLPVSVSVSRFNESLRPMLANVPIYDLPQLDVSSYEIHGGTNIYYSAGAAIKQLEAIAADTKIMVMMTDGLSDGSPHVCKAKIAELQKAGWLFVFMGMTIDYTYHGYEEAQAKKMEKQTAEQMLGVAKNLGIKPEHTIVVTAKELKDTMQQAAIMCLDFQGTGEASFTGKKGKAV